MQTVVMKEPSPAAAEVGELGDGLGEDDLVGVALEVAKDGGAEDGGDDDAAEEAEDDVVEAGGVRTVEQDFVVAGVDEVVDRDGHEGEGEEQREVDVGGEALRAKFELECKEFPELCHVNPSVSLDAVRVIAG